MLSPSVPPTSYRNSLMGMGSSGGSSHHSHHASSYLLNGHDKDFKGMYAFDKYKSNSSSPTYGGSKSNHLEEDDEEERVDIMDDDEDEVTPASSTNGQQAPHHSLLSHGESASQQFHSKLFSFDHTKPTSVATAGTDPSSKSGKTRFNKTRALFSLLMFLLNKVDT